MEMLRKAELMCQKRKRQLMNRQIAELEQELANFANNSIETMTVEDYNALREKLRLLPKVWLIAFLIFLIMLANCLNSFSWYIIMLQCVVKHLLRLAWLQDVRENSKGKALIAKIEQEAYLSRSRVTQNTSQPEEQKKAFRKAELAVIDNNDLNLLIWQRATFILVVRYFYCVPLPLLWHKNDPVSGYSKQAQEGVCYAEASYGYRGRSSTKHVEED